MTWRRHAWIRQRRNMQILRKVGAHNLLLENLIKQCFIAWAKYDVVMAQIGVIVAAFISEINHHQRHRLLAEFNQRIAVDPPMGLIHQLEVSRRVVSV